MLVESDDHNPSLPSSTMPLLILPQSFRPAAMRLLAAGDLPAVTWSDRSGLQGSALLQLPLVDHFPIHHRHNHLGLVNRVGVD